MTTAAPRLSARIGAGVSTLPDPMDAALAASESAIAGLDGRAVTLGFVFFSPHYLPHLDDLITPLLSEVGAGTLIGATTEAPIGMDREVEDEPGLSLWLAHLPQSEITPFALSMQNTPDGTAMVGFPLMASTASAALLVADGFSFPTQALLTSLNGDHPNLPVIGGQASGGTRPGEHVLILNDRMMDSGAVGALVVGGEVQTVVSQGCRPIGDPYVITEAEGNIIISLGGKPALDRLRESVVRLSDTERDRAMTNLHIGLAINERKSELEPGDFLVRSILQANMQTGAIAVGDIVQVGQMVQFQMRDAESADLDLEMGLEGCKGQIDPAGALLFTCNGRGQRLFSEPSHDAAALRSTFGDIGVAGMFCQGEIGPIGGRNFLHGYTASIAIFGR